MIDSQFSDRLKLDERNQRVVTFTLDEMRGLKERAIASVDRAESGMKRTSLRHIIDLVTDAVESFEGLGAIPARERIYQFKLTLLDFSPVIWRRIQVKDSTLDKFHERIQTAMGWTNSHLNQFRIDGKLFGDLLLMEEDFDEFGYKDSTVIKLSEVLPRTGERFRFEYEYDFGDGWTDEVLFEGCLRVEPGRFYPICLEGERACPPEDVGGISGYGEFLEVLADPSDEQHEQFVGWIGGTFDRSCLFSHGLQDERCYVSAGSVDGALGWSSSASSCWKMDRPVSHQRVTSDRRLSSVNRSKRRWPVRPTP